MKKYLIYIALFFGLVVVVDFGFGKLCNYLTDHAIGGSIKEINNTAKVQKAELLVMGSSRAHHHYVPEVIADTLGLTVYNAGIDGNGIVTATGLFSIILNRYQPKVIIYDITKGFDIYVFSEDGNNTRYLGALRPYFGYSGVDKVLEMVDPAEKYKNLSAMFRYNSKIVNLIKDQFHAGNFREDGYLPLFATMKSDVKEEKSDESKKMCPDNIKLRLLEDFVRDVKHSGTHLVVVVSPYYGAVSSQIFNPAKEICSRYNVEFWDYYSDLTYQHAEYFADHSHLNDEGAKVFSSEVARRLKVSMGLEKRNY